MKYLIVLIATCTFGCTQPGSKDVAEQTPEKSLLYDELEAIHSDILSGDYGYIDHFLMIKDDSVLFDEGYEQDYSTIMLDYDTTNYQYNYDHPQWHPFYNNTKLHSLQSVTKSVTSLLLGIAMDDGLINSVSDPAMTYFTDFNPDMSNNLRARMTIEDLLTMRSGIAWDEENYDLSTNSCTIMEGSNNWIDYILTQPMDTLPGSNFEYNSGASVLLGKIVREATGQRIDKWAEERLFGPLGISEYFWKITPQGEVDTEGGLYLSTHDLAKIGQLVLNGGTYKNEQLVSSDWIEKSTAQHVTFPDESGYGYQWWVPSVSPEVIAGNGYGGQFLFILPEHEVILVFNGWNIHDRPAKSSFMVLKDRIIPLL